MANEVALGLIGCGGNMGAHVRGYRALWEAGLRDFRIAAACDIQAPKAEALADEVAAFQGTRPTVYLHSEALLDGEPGIDACDLSLVHRDHHTVAIPCLQAGKHLTIEKPLAITCRAAQAIVDAARDAGRILQTAENYRRSPENRAIRWAIEQGRIGTPRMLYWIDVRERVWYWGWREHRDLAGGGWTMDGGVHFADLFRYHLGEIDTLYAISRTHFPTRYRDRESLTDPTEATVEDTTMAVFEFQSGASGQWTSSNVAPGRGFCERAIFGSEGSITWGQGLQSRTETVEAKQLVAEHAAAMDEAERQRFFPRGLTDTIASELWEFVQAVLGNGEVETDGAEGLKDLAVCMAVYESSRLARPVRVAAVERCEVEAYQADLNEAAGL
ncbi:MAG: Gfo/Idh/MocA family protein [Candidatus Brocadiia bacterium]